MSTSQITNDDIKKVEEKLNADSNALDTLLADVDSNWNSKKDENRFSGLSEEWRKYRELCIVILREFMINRNGNKDALSNKCSFNVSPRIQFESFKSDNADYSSISKDSDYWKKIAEHKKNLYSKKENKRFNQFLINLN